MRDLTNPIITGIKTVKTFKANFHILSPDIPGFFMYNKYTIPYIIITAILLVLSSCNENYHLNDGDKLETAKDSVVKIPDPIEFDLDKIHERGILRVLLDNNSATYFLYKGEPLGFE